MTHDSTLPTIKARPTTCNGIQMRSRLEAAHAEQFDAFKWTWQYEPQCFAGTQGQYLPDFMLDFSRSSEDDPEADTCAHVYVEVKPWIDYGQVNDVLMAAAEKWWPLVRGGDAKATGFLVCFGADSDGACHWFALTSERSVPIPVSPRALGRDTYLMADVSAGIFATRRHVHRTPVASLYASSWATALPHREDVIALRLLGM